MVIFQPFIIPKSDIEIHFSDIKLRSGRGGRHSFSFALTSSNLEIIIQKFKDELPISEPILEQVDEQIPAIKQEVEEIRIAKQRTCFPGETRVLTLNGSTMIKFR